jgi:hypothetical protein
MNDILGHSRLQTEFKRSPLLGLYQSKRATLIEHDHWLFPAHFGIRLRNTNGSKPCRYTRSLPGFTGRDASFLNRLISNDLTALTSGQGLHAAFTGPEGNILSDARIFAQPILFSLISPRHEKKLHCGKSPRKFDGGVHSWPPVWVWTDGGKTSDPKGEVGILQRCTFQYSTCGQMFLIHRLRTINYMGCLMIDNHDFCEQIVKLLQGHCNCLIVDIGSLDVTFTF